MYKYLDKEQEVPEKWDKQYQQYQDDQHDP